MWACSSLRFRISLFRLCLGNGSTWITNVMAWASLWWGVAFLSRLPDSRDGVGRWRRRQDAGRGLLGTPADHCRAAWAAASGSLAMLPDGPPLQQCHPGAYQKGRCRTSSWLRLQAPNARDVQFGSLIRELDPTGYNQESTCGNKTQCMCV